MQRKATIRHNAARLACVLLAFLTFALPSAATPAATARLPSVSARGAVLYDASEGGAGVLWEKNAHARMPMASTTKIMTALVAIESLPLTTAIQIPAAAVGVEGSSVYLREGEKQTLEALLYAMMLESANDAATAIAIAVAGSVEAFAELMNRRAADMGLGDTHFVNPHGLDAPEHFTSAYDLALIASEALKNPELRKIAGTYRSSMPLGDESGARLLINHNRLLRSYPGAIGGKTGFTKKAADALFRQPSVTGCDLLRSHCRHPTTGRITNACSTTALPALKTSFLPTPMSSNMPFRYRAANRGPFLRQTPRRCASRFPALTVR